MFARIRHLASHTEGHSEGKKSLLGPSSSSGRRLCALSGKSLLFILPIADGKNCRNIHLSVFCSHRSHGRACCSGKTEGGHRPCGDEFPRRTAVGCAGSGFL